MSERLSGAELPAAGLNDDTPSYGEAEDPFPFESYGMFFQDKANVCFSPYDS